MKYTRYTENLLMQEIEKHLTEHGIRPTAVRLLVWKEAELHHWDLLFYKDAIRRNAMRRVGNQQALKLR